MFRRVLVANRGEIAVRVIRACRELGIASVAVYSEADRSALPARLADIAVLLGPAAPAESYLSVDAVIDAARRTKADAVHPGYGFLSENAGFAARCERAGLVFIGPPADVIGRMGSKLASRRLMAAAGVPVVPGVEPRDQTPAALERAARGLGLPLLVKASAGGGGRGMRVVTDFDELPAAIDSARREASSGFGDGTLYFERLLPRARHVEVQILADAGGHIVHLFERDCSVQRRHQKVIEESPSPALSPSTRQRLLEAASAAARAAGYRNAGTVEFLVDSGADGQQAFYFLEMNTRLQVEHPVTEEVTGLDLVRAQIGVAAGQPLAWRQDQITTRGHAIECRVYAEAPHDGFLPRAGRVLHYREPRGPGIRVDSGIAEGSEVPPNYDALLAKVIASGETRDIARARLTAALRSYVILGVETNVAFLLRVLEHASFQSGRIDTAFVDTNVSELVGPPDPGITRVAAAALAAAGHKPAQAGGASAGGAVDPWTILGPWRA